MVMFHLYYKLSNTLNAHINAHKAHINAENIAWRMCCTYEKLLKTWCNLRDIFFARIFIIVRLVMCTTFSFFFSLIFFNPRHLKQRQLLIGNEWKIRSKRESYGQFLKADINKFLNPLYYYKFSVKIMFEFSSVRLSFTWFCKFSLFTFKSAVWKISLY